MPRHQRCRRIEGYPDYWVFSPDDADDMPDSVTLSLDEFETIRLIDKEGLTQGECAERMQVARTTVTSIYASARHKLALAIVDGRRLQIAGGAYELRQRRIVGLAQKGQDIMRIAVTYDGNGQIFQHFGRTEQFKLYDVEDGKIVSSQVVGTNGQGHGALGGFLRQCQADVLICGGIGMGAQNAVAEAGIQLYGGVSGDADKAAQALVDGSLQFNPDVPCDHHGHGEGHDCGGHGEGHSCCH